jgi:hypothetical protein
MSTTGHLLQIMMPGASSHKRYSSFRPGEETDARMQGEIIKHIPPLLGVGIAIGKGDCFFDCIAQQLSLTRSEKYDVKSLRLLCQEYVMSGKHGWVKAAILKDERGQAGYENYLARVSFTCEEMEKFDREGTLKGEATWGRPDIEGVLFCKELGIRIHIIEVDPTIDPPIRHQLIDHEKSRSVEETSINYHDANTVHIIAFRNHFIPILPRTVLNVPAEELKAGAHTEAPGRTTVVSNPGQSTQKTEAEEDKEKVKKQKHDDKKIEDTPGEGPSLGKR